MGKERNNIVSGSAAALNICFPSDKGDETFTEESREEEGRTKKSLVLTLSDADKRSEHFKNLSQNLIRHYLGIFMTYLERKN